MANESHTLRHNENNILEGMTEEKRGRGRPKTNYISQIVKLNSYKQLKNKIESIWGIRIR